VVVVQALAGDSTRPSRYYNSMMRRFRNMLAAVASLLSLAGADIPAPPAIAPGGIVNAASRLPASLRGGAIAPGARFTIPGVRLGPDIGVRGSESDPPVKLAAVSVRIAQRDRVVDAGLLLVSAIRIDAWMPEGTPLGNVQLTVTYQGRASEPYDLTVVRASVGFYSSETAPESLPAAKRKLEAAPGDTVTLWGTGWGETALDLFVGGKPAEEVRATAAACCHGVEQVAFRVPAAAPLGCFVPVQARTRDGRPSNVIPIAVHAPGQACRDDVDWFRESVEHAARAGFVALARVSLAIKLAPRVGSRFQFDYGIGSFGRQESGQRQFPPLPPANTCTVFTARLNLRQIMGQTRTPTEWTSIPAKTPGNRRLDAGAAISVSGPAGERALHRDARQHDYYGAILGGLAPFSREAAKPRYLSHGSYTVSAPGGGDIGPFSVKLDVPPAVVWKNRDRIDEIERDAGVTLEWKAARGNDAILILAVNADRYSGDSAVCLCMARARDGRFRIPPIALGNLPTTLEDDDLSASYLVVAEIPLDPPARIEARGLDAAFAAFVSVSGRLVKYK
jgi:uncharacterized protein (TIGR03437 family)